MQCAVLNANIVFFISVCGLTVTFVGVALEAEITVGPGSERL